MTEDQTDTDDERQRDDAGTEGNTETAPPADTDAEEPVRSAEGETPPESDGPGQSSRPEESPDEDIEEPPPAQSAGEAEEAFEEVGVDEVDPDEVWSEVTEEGDEAEKRPSEEDIADVSKHDYCEVCQHFSQAPEIHCTHEGTEIREFIDMETVRVANCPVVAERRGLEQGVSAGSTDLEEIADESQNR